MSNRDYPGLPSRNRNYPSRMGSGRMRVVKPAGPQQELSELTLPPLTARDKIQNTIYTVLGLHGGVFVVTFIYICLFEARYRFGDVVYSLGPAWNALPVTLRVTSWLNWIPVPGTGGLGSWIINNWDLIQHVYFNKVPAGIVAFTFIGLVLGLGAGKPLGHPKAVDKLFIGANRMFRIFPNRYQGHRTTSVQYAVLPFSMLAAALPGVIVGSVLIYGGAALLHHFGLNPFGSGLLAFPHFHALRFILAGSIWQPIAIGALGQHFFARYVTLKAGEDVQSYFLESRADNAYDAGTILDGYKGGTITETQAINEISGMHKATPSGVYPPIYRHRLSAMLKAHVPVPEHGNEARIVMPAILAFLTVAVLLGAYWYTWLPKHGGWLP